MDFSFKKGDRVKVTGDNQDFTEELDGRIGEVFVVGETDCAIRLDNGEVYLIWNRNMTLVNDSK